MRTQLAVLGGGPGGYAAAFLAADLGMEVTLVEAESRLGGVCLLKGCIPSKALLHVAKVIGEAREMQSWGVSYEPPVVDIDVMRSRKEEVVKTLSGGLKQLAKQRKVRVIQARGRFASSQSLSLEGGDPKTRTEDHLEFEHCVVAVGSSPTVIPAFDLSSERMMDSTSALNLPDVPRSLLVIGGGYIGLEMGTVYAALGSQVTVVELTPGLLPGADRELVKPLAKRLRTQFAAIHLNTKVVSLTDKGDSIEATLEGEVDEKLQRFDRVLVSVGRRPNTRDLGLENTQAELDPQGFIKVDDRMRTADPRVLAIGDAAGEPMLAHKAAHQGKVAVEALAGEPATFEPMAIPAVVFTDPEIAWAGLSEDDAKRQGVSFHVARYPWAASGRAQSLARTEGLTKWIVEQETNRVLGIRLVGAGAGELVAEAVLAIEMGCTLRDVADSIHPHPTLSETVGAAAEVPLGIATDLYRPKRTSAAGR